MEGMDAKTIAICVGSFIFLVFAFIIIFIIIDLAIPPQKVAIVNATLTRFELATNSATSLSYNLTFTMSIRNSIWDNKADYHGIEVDCYYNTEQFDWLRIRDFMIKPRRTRLFNFLRSGNATVNLGSSGIDDFRRSNETGFFELTIWLHGNRIFQVDQGDRHLHLSYACKLNLPLITSQNNTKHIGSFQPVKYH